MYRGSHVPLYSNLIKSLKKKANELCVRYWTYSLNFNKTPGPINKY